MATNEQGILGGFSGKVGTVIGVKWNGVDYMKGIPSKIANPQTAKQQNQRTKFAIIVQYLKPLKAFLRDGFKKQAVKMSAFNAATSYNLAHAVMGISPDFEVDYSKILVSQGKLPAALNPAVNSLIDGKVEFTWEDNSADKGASPNDKAMLLVYDVEKGKTFAELNGNIRAGGSQILTLPTEFEGAEVQCYIAFQNAGQTVISDSQYAGAMMV